MERDNPSPQKLTLNRKWLWILIVVLIVLAALTVAFLPREKPIDPAALSEVALAVQAGKVTEIEDAYLTGDLLVHYTDGTSLKSVRDTQTTLLEQLNLLGVDENHLAAVRLTITKTGASSTSVTGILVLFTVIGMAVFVASRTTSMQKIGQKSFEETAIPTTTFKDVAGMEENMQELQDVVTFLKEGNKYAEMGARMPHGVLMVGEPGTGKTLMARAVAGEAGVPFFATSGSEFTEVFVGVGAARMRSLFKKARKSAPCIIFVDEIDAVGRARRRSESGAEMEQDQTLNQLLVEMDGFSASDGIVILAATNREDVLDPALTRPGRFDRRVYINKPDIKGRKAILAIHTRGKKVNCDVCLENIAKATPGLVGADLANIVNEAAISAVRHSHTEICMPDFMEAIEKHIAGVQRTSQVMSKEEREIIAYHEAGHAVVMNQTPMCDPVYKITIIPRGRAGGYTLALPEQDQNLISRCKLLARITGLLGGRAAEEIFFQDITSGASNDLSVATQLAEEMVMRLGMHPSTGLRVYPQASYSSLFGLTQSSQKTHETIDDAVKSILDECYTNARRIIEEKRDTLERLANELLDKETLDREQFLSVIR